MARTVIWIVWHVPDISCCVAVSFSAGHNGSLSPVINMQGHCNFNKGPACSTVGATDHSLQ